MTDLPEIYRTGLLNHVSETIQRLYHCVPTSLRDIHPTYYGRLRLQLGKLMMLLQRFESYKLLDSPEIEHLKRQSQELMIATSQLPKHGDWETLKQWGVKITGEADELCYVVSLPDGWKIKTTDHSRSVLKDTKGITRANIFYEGIFYDRTAAIRLVSNVSDVPLDHLES